MYLCTCKTTLDLHEFGFTRGRTKTGVGVGGEEGMQSKGHICTCSVLLPCFGDICQQVFGLFLRMTQHVIYSQVYVHVIMNESMWLGGGGGGGGNCCQKGAMGEWGGGPLAPTPKAMLDPGLHGTYLDLS